MQNSDKSLVDAHCKGSTTAFAELLQRYGSIVLGFLIQMTGNYQQAEDLFQETFKRLHEKADSFRGTNLKPWLLKIATNMAINNSRKNKNLKLISLDQEIECKNGNCEKPANITITDNPLNKLLNAEYKEQLRQAVSLLPPKQRATLVLAYYHQLTYPEVATTLGCSLGTVKTQMYRALKKLNQKLPDPGGETK